MLIPAPFCSPIIHCTTNLYRSYCILLSFSLISKHMVLVSSLHSSLEYSLSASVASSTECMSSLTSAERNFCEIFGRSEYECNSSCSTISSFLFTPPPNGARSWLESSILFYFFVKYSFNNNRILFFFRCVLIFFSKYI